MEWTKERVRELRLRMGWSQSDLARHLEVEIGTIHNIETGQDVDFDLVGSRLTLYWSQAESRSNEVQMSALAEQTIEENNLSQLFRSELHDKFT
jgi:transcriptional regulator with XRE-family HTH domain